MEEYKRLFDVYLRMAVRLYDPQRPYDNLEVCCRQCIRLREQLLGMCQLLEATGDMTMEEAEKELTAFSARMTPYVMPSCRNSTLRR